MKRRFYRMLPAALLLSVAILLSGCDTDGSFVPGGTTEGESVQTTLSIREKRTDPTTAAYRYGGYRLRGSDAFARVRVNEVTVKSLFRSGNEPQTWVVRIDCTVLEDCYGTLEPKTWLMLALPIPEKLLEQTDGVGDTQAQLAAGKLADFLNRWENLFVYLNTKSTVDFSPDGCIAFSGCLLNDLTDGCIIPVQDDKLNLTALSKFLSEVGLLASADGTVYPADFGEYGAQNMSADEFFQNIRQLRQDMLSLIESAE